MKHEDLQPVVASLANHAMNHIPSGIGFTILVFEFGEEPGLGLAYASNAHRVDMVATMREFITRPENRHAVRERLMEILADGKTMIAPTPIAEARDKDTMIPVPRALLRRLVADVTTLSAFAEEVLPTVKEIGVSEYMNLRLERAGENAEAIAELGDIDADNEDLDD